MSLFLLAILEFHEILPKDGKHEALDAVRQQSRLQSTSEESDHTIFFHNVLDNINITENNVDGVET